MFFEPSSKHRNMLGAILLAALLGGVIYLFLLKSFETPGQVSCTQEAMLCSDGSYVGRTGPSCEFAACPGDVSPTLSDAWETHADPGMGISFRYPKKLPTKYITPVEWPPSLAVMDGPFTCVETGSGTMGEEQITEHIINSRIYCVTTASEGAAGSIYADYTYRTQSDNRVLALAFSLRAVQCANYGDLQQSECENERGSFDLDKLVDQIVQSARVLGR